MLRISPRQLPMPDISVFGSTVELLLNASSNRAAREGAIVSGRKRGMYMSETRLVARAIIINARHKRASGALSPYAQARHLPCALSWRGRVFASRRARWMLYRAGLNLMGESRASAAKSTIVNAPQLEKWAAPSNSHPRQ